MKFDDFRVSRDSSFESSAGTKVYRWDATPRVVAQKSLFFLTLVYNCHEFKVYLQRKYRTVIATENGPVEIVDLPMKNGDFP